MASAFYTPNATLAKISDCKYTKKNVPISHRDIFSFECFSSLCFLCSYDLMKISVIVN